MSARTGKIADEMFLVVVEMLEMPARMFKIPARMFEMPARMFEMPARIKIYIKGEEKNHKSPAIVWIMVWMI